MFQRFNANHINQCKFYWCRIAIKYSIIYANQIFYWQKYYYALKCVRFGNLLIQVYNIFRYHKSFFKRISYYRLRNSECILTFNLLSVTSLSIQCHCVKLFLLLIYWEQNTSISANLIDINPHFKISCLIIGYNIF